MGIAGVLFGSERQFTLGMGGGCRVLVRVQWPGESAGLQLIDSCSAGWRIEQFIVSCVMFEILFIISIYFTSLCVCVCTHTHTKCQQITSVSYKVKDGRVLGSFFFFV